MRTFSFDRKALYENDAWDYRPFLRGAIEQIRAESPRKLSYSALARLFGFKSKSFLQHVLAGERHLSVESAERLADTLRLRDRDRSIFLCLVRLHAVRERENGSSTHSDRLRKAIRRAREKATARFTPLAGAKQTQSLYGDSHAILVYAGLGSREKGGCLADVEKRTRLPKKKIAECLDRLYAGGIITRKSEGAGFRYFADQPLIFDRSEESRGFIRDFFVKTANEALKKAETGFSAPENLFVTYAVSIDSSKLPDLQDRVKKLLADFVIESEAAEGDQVARISFSLT